jgi:hypothetical protein
MSFRTNFDITLQNEWCPKCGDSQPPQPHHPPHPGKPFSFVCSPGIGCHEDSSPPRAPNNYSNLQACQANCRVGPAPQPGKPFSFVCSPGIGCHEDSSPPKAPNNYSNLQACQANCR